MNITTTWDEPDSLSPARRTRPEDVPPARDPHGRTEAPPRERPGSSPDEEGRSAPPRGRDGDGASPRPSLVRRHPGAFLFGVLTLAGAGIGGSFYWQNARHFVATEDAFIDARPFGVTPKVGGYVTAVLVTDNQHVEAGTPLLRIDPHDYDVALDRARAGLASAEAQVSIRDAQLVAQAAQIEQSEAQVRQAQAVLDLAQVEAKRSAVLVDRGAGTVQRSQQAASDLLQREADLARAGAALSGARRQVDVIRAERGAAAAGVARSRAEVGQAELDLSYTVVTALQAGHVVRLSAAVGQYAAAGRDVSMFVPDRMWVTANFKETQLADMRPGQAATFTIDAYPGRTVRGRVESIQRGSGTAFSLLPAENATGNFVKVVQRVPVKIVSDEWPADLAVGPGLSVQPSVAVR